MVAQAQQQQQSSGLLNPKKVAAYFKKSLKGNTIWTQKLPDEGSLLITDRYAMIKLPQGTEVEITFFSPYETTMFKPGARPEAYAPEHFQESWKRFMGGFTDELWVQRLIPTAYLYELPSRLIRRFDTPEGQHIWIEKGITECIASDAEGLEAFEWEVQTHTKHVRVGQRDGWCAIVMPWQFRAGEDKS